MLSARIASSRLRLEFDLAAQYVLNRHDVEVEKAKWGVSDDNTPKGSTPKLPTPPLKGVKRGGQTMTMKDIMRQHK